MLSEDIVKQIFFHSDRPRKDALIANEVDIVQFANNLLAVAAPMIARQEHQRCVGMVMEMNREVGKALDSQRP